MLFADLFSLIIFDKKAPIFLHKAMLFEREQTTRLLLLFAYLAVYNNSKTKKNCHLKHIGLYDHYTVDFTRSQNFLGRFSVEGGILIYTY